VDRGRNSNGAPRAARAREEGLTAVQVALGALLARREITAVLVGMNSPADNQRAAGTETGGAISEDAARELFRQPETSRSDSEARRATLSPLEGG
jgi:aryl-alcohol dehydrogenase-like predicted oxidoreductase